MLTNNVDVIVNGKQDILSTLATYTIEVLKPNIVDGRNILTAGMLGHANTKYIIRWDFDLNGATITIPAGCIIEFDGGSISNGTLVGQDTLLVYDQELEDVLKNVTLSGTFIHKNGGSAADEEDITNKEGELKFADKDYEPNKWSGLGRKYLRKNVIDVLDDNKWALLRDNGVNYLLYTHHNKVYGVSNSAGTEGLVRNNGPVAKNTEYDIETVSQITKGNRLAFNSETLDVTMPDGTIVTKATLDATEMPWFETVAKEKKNVLTQDMLSEANTIYHIQYDYDLNGQTITIPDRCVLEFEGGSLRNGTLNGKVIFNKSIDVRELGLIYNQKSAAAQNTARLQILSGLTSDIHLIISDTLYLGEGSVTIKGSLSIDGKENNIYLDNFSGINVEKDVSITSVKVFGTPIFDTSDNYSFFITSVASDYHSSIYVNNCYFSGKLRVFTSTNYSDALLTKYHNTISFTNNVFENIYPRPSARVIHLADVNFIDLIFESNIVHNFYGIIIEAGITNDTEYVTNIKNFYEKNGRTVTFKDNVISNDKELKPWEHFITQGYYSPLVLETGDCIYEHNIVTDIITNTPETATYSAYLSVTNLIFQYNTIKNCVNLTGSYNQLLKAKMGGGTRYYYKNTFVIEKSIEDYFSDIENINISTILIDIQGDTLDSLIIKDNIFDIYKLNANFNYKAKAARIELLNNIFNIELLSAYNNSGIIGTGVGDYSRNIYISNNNIFVDNFYNVSDGSSKCVFALLGKANTGDDIVCIEKNHLKNLVISYNSYGRIIGKVEDNDIKINNNYIGTGVGICGVSPSYDLTISNNTLLFDEYNISSSDRLFRYLLGTCVIDYIIEFNSNNNVKLLQFIGLTGIYKLDIFIIELSTGATIKHEINLEISDGAVQRCLSYNNNGNLTEFTGGTTYLYNFGDSVTSFCKCVNGAIIYIPSVGKHHFKLSLTKIQDFYKLNNYIGQGDTAKRPALLQANNAGFRYFDTTLGKPIYFNGTGWVDATGATV